MNVNFQFIYVRSISNVVGEMLAPFAQLKGLQLKINSEDAP